MRPDGTIEAVVEFLRRAVPIAGTDRAVSTTIGYVLGLMIASLLISGLFIAGGSTLENQHDTAVTSGLEASGERIATGYSDADRLVEAAGGGNVTVAVAIDAPKRIASSGYAISVTGGADGPPYTNTIELEGSDGSITHTVRFRSFTPVSDRSIDGGPVVIRYVEGEGLRIERGQIE
ncbi:hypothetical protein ACERIT_07720 [Halopenitus sp. H-Gu1]|uniref:DUF7266 family protein n=1 Tax=Halopenitus sp. H-Gu1 TaxID=3242697 RepID=UPI00359D75A5